MDNPDLCPKRDGGKTDKCLLSIASEANRNGKFGRSGVAVDMACTGAGTVHQVRPSYHEPVCPPSRLSTYLSWREEEDARRWER